jgi:putative transposase
MDEKKREEIALFRYGLIAEFCNKQFQPGEKTALLKEKVSQSYVIPHSDRDRISLATIKDWITRYRRGGFEALKPKGRSDQGHSRALSAHITEYIIRLKEENPARSAPVIARELELSGILASSQKVAASTIHRFLAAQGLADKQSPAPQDRRHFEYASPGQLCQSDCLYGPKITDSESGKGKKTYLYAFLDDATRVIYHAQFYFAEGLIAFEHAFKQALLKRGVPARLYCDNGPVYRSHHLQVVCASLGIVLIHARAYVPQGKGKIERFFRTTRMRFIDQLDLSRIKGLEDLNSRLWAWIEGEYHRSPHSGLKDGETPLDKWVRLSEQVKYLSPQIDLEEIFLHRMKRKIYADRTLSLEGVLYEAPAHLAGRQVEIRFNPKDKREVKIYFGGRLEGIAKPADPYHNCFVKRDDDSKQLRSAAPRLEVKKSAINYVELVQQSYYQKQPAHKQPAAQKQPAPAVRKCTAQEQQSTAKAATGQDSGREDIRQEDIRQEDIRQEDIRQEGIRQEGTGHV